MASGEQEIDRNSFGWIGDHPQEMAIKAGPGNNKEMQKKEPDQLKRKPRITRETSKYDQRSKSTDGETSFIWDNNQEAQPSIGGKWQTRSFSATSSSCDPPQRRKDLNNGTAGDM
jgi:hypothetical protein